MDLRQKYTEEHPYLVDENLIEELLQLPIHLALDVAKQIDDNYLEVIDTGDIVSSVGAVSNIVDPPMFFRIDYVKPIGDLPTVFVAVSEITSDEYLDLYLQQKTFK